MPTPRELWIARNCPPNRPTIPLHPTRSVPSATPTRPRRGRTSANLNTSSSTKRTELPSAQERRQEVELVAAPKPLSAFNDDPLLDTAGAATYLAVEPDTLKKWRQRRQGPDYIQYGPNGPVRYAVKALIEFLGANTVRDRASNPRPRSRVRA